MGRFFLILVNIRIYFALSLNIVKNIVSSNKNKANFGKKKFSVANNFEINL